MSDSWQSQLEQAVDNRFDQMVSIRRRMHTSPELSGEERETSLYLYQLLGEEGFDVRIGPEGRGVLVNFAEDDGEATGTIGLRADIDALPIHDAKEVEYRSSCDGIMHACGHDGHTALIFGAISALRDLHNNGGLPCPIRFRGIFQPAEETCQGAREMIEVGAIEDVDAILATHVDPTRPLGCIGLREGVLTAAFDEMRITVTGRGGHAARPHETADPIAAAAQLINSLYLYIPRVTDSQDSVVVSIGQISGGHSANVIPEQVELRGTVRTLDASIRSDTVAHIHRLADGVAQTTETDIKVEFRFGCHPVRNDGQLVKLIDEAATAIVGTEGVQAIPRSSMGSEDFAYYVEHIPGAMIRLGCTSDEKGGSPLHTPTFDLDERALAIGAKILARTAVNWFLDRR